MAPAKLRSHLYLRAVRWIAKEAPQEREDIHALPLAQSAPVRLSAALWDRPTNLIARDVLEERRRAV